MTLLNKKMKTRKHHNNKGLRQIRNGKPAREMKALARKMGILFKSK
jgi:hypothetical protein